MEEVEPWERGEAERRVNRSFLQAAGTAPLQSLRVEQLHQPPQCLDVPLRRR